MGLAQLGTLSSAACFQENRLQVIRPESHETDTAARKRVPLCFPDEWEHRELTGRDYGIDMQIDLFRDGRTSGRTVLLQIKGTSKAVPRIDEFAMDLDVRLVKDSLLFAVPILLVVCPIKEEPPFLRFAWLQDSARVVLDHENPHWRANKATVRIRFCAGDCLPGLESKIWWLAGQPGRLLDVATLARAQHELRKLANESLDTLQVDGVLELGKIRLVDQLVNQIANTLAFYGDEDWLWAKRAREHHVGPTIEAAEVLAAEYRALFGLGTSRAIRLEVIEEDRARYSNALETIAWGARMISADLSIFSDHHLAYGVRRIDEDMLSEQGDLE